MQVKKYFVRSIVTGMVVMALACNKDDQSFVYKKINEVAIENGTTNFTVAVMDSLIIMPKLVESMPEGDEYSYSWAISSNKMAEKTVSTNKDLRMKVELAQDSYKVIFTAKNKKTGVSAFSRYFVTVNGIYYAGWYVVHNKDGKGKFSLIRTDDVVFDNPIETVNHKTYSGKALSGYFIGSILGSDINLLYFFMDQGVYKFNANDLTELGGTAETLPGFKTLPFKTVPYYTVSHLPSFTLLDQYIVADGGVYAGLGPALAPTEVLKPFSDRFFGDYELFPGVFPASLTTIYFYDNKNMRFMQATYLGRTISNSPASSASAAFNLSNVGRKMIAFDKGVVSTSEFYYIMENSAGRYLMSTVGVSPGINQQILNSPEINNATNFATSSILKQMYYSVGNKIYLYDMLANSSRLIYTFPSGYLIKDMEMLRTTSTTLLVGTNNGNDGEVYYFSIDGLGNFVSNTYAKKFTGFGEIVQLSPR